MKNNIGRLLGVAFAALFYCLPAIAQNAGTVTAGAYAIGLGPGKTGYASLLCGSAQLAVGQSAAAPICRTLTGDVTIDVTGVTAIGSLKVVTGMLANNAVTLAKLATIANNRALCNVTGGASVPVECTATQLTTLVNPFTTTLSGAVPAPGSVSAKFLRDDGTWQAVAGAGTVTSGAYPLSGTTVMNYVGPTKSGQLQFVSSTSIVFNTYDGDIVRIAGAVYQIPSGGVASGTPTSVFLNGVASQTLAINTTYYVYVFNNSGTLALDFSTTAAVQDTAAGNVGTYIKTGAASRTLVGMIRTGGTVIFVNSAAQRFVRSWFNDPGVATTNNFTALRTVSTTGYSEINTEIRNEFLTWSGEPVVYAATAVTYANTAGMNPGMSVGFDGTTAEDAYAETAPSGANSRAGFSLTSVKLGLSEGYHYATLLGYINNAGTANWDSGTPGRRTVLSTYMRKP